MEGNTLMTLEDFEDLLSSFDWTYEYSDDPRVYRENAEIHDIIYYVMGEADRQGDASFRKLYHSLNPFKQE
jgi:hypothetical protein